MGLTRIRAQQISNIDYKQAVRVVTTTNIASLAGGAPNSVDGVNLVAGDRILVTGQNTGSENGLYQVQTLGTGSNGTWTRTSDGNETGEIEAGMVVMVTEGATYADTPWKLTTNDPIVVGTTALVFVQFSSGSGTPGGSNTQIQFNSANTFAGSSSLTWSGSELYVNGTANVTGNVTGNYFIGNGSQLTGISTSTNRIFSGDSNVDIASANANVTVSVAGTSNVAVFSTTGLAVTGTVTGNGIATTTVSNTAPANPEQGDVWIVGNTGVQLIYFTSGGNSQWAEMEATTSIEIQDYGNANVVANLAALSSNPVSTTGNVTAGYFLGNGSQLTGLPAGYANSNVAAYAETGWAGNIIPAANITYDLGNATNRWQDIWLSNSTIYLGSAQISADGSAVVLPANSTVGGSQIVVETNGSSEFAANVTAGNLISQGIVSATGNITGNYILGNGSQLTGITGGSSATNGIFVNTSNVSANYTIAAGTNGMSVGPITVNNGIVATVANGQRWVIL